MTGTRRISVDQAKKVDCPTCLAKAGSLCVSTTGAFMRTVVHIGRKRALHAQSQAS